MGSFCITAMASVVNYVLRSNIGVWPALALSLALTLALIFGFLRSFYAYQVLALDRQTAEMCVVWIK